MQIPSTFNYTLMEILPCFHLLIITLKSAIICRLILSNTIKNDINACNIVIMLGGFYMNGDRA